MKRSAFWLLAAVALIVVSCCAEPTETPTQAPVTAPTQAPAAGPTVAPPPTAAPPPIEEESIVITLTSWEGESGVEQIQRIIDGFQAKYPNIKVEHQPIPDDYETKLLTQIAAGTAPDVITVGEVWIPYFVENGGLLDLSPFIDDPEIGIDASQYYPEVYQVGVVDGKTYLLNKDFSTVAVLINTDIFDAAGIPYPEEGWTMEDFVDICQELTVDANGNNAKSPNFDPENVVQWGSDMRWNWFMEFGHMYYSFGATSISPDGTTTDGYMNSEEMAQAIEHYRDLIHKYHCMPTSAQAEALDVELFGAKLAAMKYAYGPWRLTEYKENPDLNFAVVPLPAGPTGHHGVVCWAGFGVYPGTEHPREAYLLVKELASEPGQLVLSENALANMPSVNELTGKADDVHWGQYVREISYIHPLDQLKNPAFKRCIEDPFAAQILDVIISDEGISFDPRPALDGLVQEADGCLAEE